MKEVHAKRTDVVVDYQGEQFVVELKIWHGSEYNKRGERQLAEYLDYFHQEKGVSCQNCKAGPNLRQKYPS